MKLIVPPLDLSKAFFLSLLNLRSFFFSKSCRTQEPVRFLVVPWRCLCCNLNPKGRSGLSLPGGKYLVQERSKDERWMARIGGWGLLVQGAGGPSRRKSGWVRVCGAQGGGLLLGIQLGFMEESGSPGFSCLSSRHEDF